MCTIYAIYAVVFIYYSLYYTHYIHPFSYASSSEDLPDGAVLYAVREPAHVPAGPAHQGMCTVLLLLLIYIYIYIYTCYCCACSTLVLLYYCSLQYSSLANSILLHICCCIILPLLCLLLHMTCSCFLYYCRLYYYYCMSMYAGLEGGGHGAYTVTGVYIEHIVRELA